jgi:diacylglycerol kinase (ATP)
MKRCAIINPWSGNGRTGRIQSVILEKIKDITSDHIITQYPGHCREAARLAHDFDGLIAVGGDGTIGEVINGMDLERQTLAIVPTGTGNSLARDFGIQTIESAVTVASKPAPAPIDLVHFVCDSPNGERRELYCASTASLGYAARVTELGNKRLKKLGLFCYPAASLVCALHPEYIKAAVSYDGGEESLKQVTGFMIQNARHAANFELFPDAIINDGYFDVMELNAGFMKQTLFNISVLSRLHFYRPFMTRRIHTMQIALEKPQMLMIDGEILEDVFRMLITIVPAKLKCYF